MPSVASHCASRLWNDIVDVKMASLRYSLATVGLLAAFMTLLKLFG